MTRLPWAVLSTSAALLMLTAGLVYAQPAPSSPAEILDPDAAATLDCMSAALRALGRFEVRADATTESVHEGGLKLQSLCTTTYSVDFPNRVAVDMKTDTSPAPTTP